MARRPKILVVGSYMMDLIATTPRAPQEGETVIGLRFTTAPGGKGSNQAIQCARLGAEVTMVGRVGDDAFGKALLQNSRDAGVDISRVSVDGEESTGVAQITLEVTEQDARNRITVCPGANFTLRPEHIADLKNDIGQFDLVLMQLELPMALVETVADWAAAAGVPVMLNPAPAAPLSPELLWKLRWLSPNEHEAAALFGGEMTEAGEARNKALRTAAEKFHALGGGALLVTLGEAGAVLAEGEQLLAVPAVPAKQVVDTTAAGDSFVAAFCTAVAAGAGEEAALRFAAHAASITVSRMGAAPSLPTLQEVEAQIREKEPELLQRLIPEGLRG